MEEDNAMMNTMRYLNSFPKGYRFCPTDRELIIHYLRNKVLNKPLPPNKIRDVNLYNHCPEDLSAMYGEEEDGIMYFFTTRDRKYPNGNRPRRSAGKGFWKATGVDNVIGSTRDPIGFRKALVYYQGIPKDSKKTSWIMHEYRLHQGIPQRPVPDETTLQNVAGAPRDMKLDDWVLCKVYLNRKADKKNQTATSSGSRAPPLPCNMPSTSSPGPQPQFILPDNMGYISSLPPMPDAVDYSKSSFVPHRQFYVPNDICFTSNAPSMPADVVSPSTASSVPQRQLIAPTSVASISSATPMPADVVGCYTTSPMPQRQLFNVPNNNGSISSAPPLQTTNYSTNILQDQSLHSEYLPSWLPEDNGNSFLTFLEDDYLPFDDDIKGPNNIV